MKTIKGPAIFLAQFVGNEEPFNDLISLCKWAKSLGYKGVQIPTWETGLIVITELASHLIGQLVAVHPAYNTMFDAFAPEELHGKPKERQEWAIQQLK